jgi:ABC-2 type transport system permease protein
MKRSTILATVLRRELYRFSRLTKQTVIPPLITTILFIIIFGYSLGSRISTISGFTYIQFILPGLASMGVMMNAYANTSTSLYAARFDRSIENWLTVPISPGQLVLALICGGVLRGTIIGVMTVLVAVLAIDLPVAHPIGALLWFVMCGTILASLGIISGLRAESWDTLATMSNFVLTPGIYLGGVFYSVTMLPEPWQSISYANPIFFGIDGIRFLLLGHSEVHIGISTAILLGTTLLGITICWYFLKTGYKLVK